ncbi:MAG: response regulator [Nitrospirota bacterium]|jgi:DNA-binding response OmpR family regulator
MSILLIEDEKDVRDSLATLLRSAGYHVVSAASAMEGLDSLKKNNDIRLMLVDYVMPEMSGEEFLRKVWAEEHRPPALVMTGIAPWMSMGLLELGVGYLRKPINSDLLLGTVETYMKKGASGWA